MGQQQLILLVLATIIVGLAIVVGIRAFNENSIKANSDAMIQDAVRIANDLQAWKQKPAPFGGQASVNAAAAADTADFSDASFALLGYSGGNEYVNLNGTYSLSADSPPGAVVQGINPLQQNVVTITVTGLSDRNITGVVECLGGNATVDSGCAALTSE